MIGQNTKLVTETRNQRIISIKLNGIEKTLIFMARNYIPMLVCEEEELMKKSVRTITNPSITKEYVLKGFLNSQEKLKIEQKLEDYEELELASTERYTIIQKVKSVESQKEGYIIHDNVYKDLLIIPSVDFIIFESWNTQQNYYINGYIAGCHKKKESDELISMDPNNFGKDENGVYWTKLPKPSKPVSPTKSNLCDLWGLESGGVSKNYSTVLYFEEPRDLNGTEVNFGMSRYKTDVFSVIELGKYGELFPTVEDVKTELPLYSINQCDIMHHNLVSVGTNITPSPETKLYIMLKF